MNELKPFLERILDLGKPWYIREITLDQETWKIDIYLDFKKGETFPCPLCEGENTRQCKAHDTVEKTWRHLNLFQYKAYLHARVPRVACPEHGTHLVHVPWARRKRLYPALRSLCHVPYQTHARGLSIADTR